MGNLVLVIFMERLLHFTKQLKLFKMNFPHTFKYNLIIQNFDLHERF